LGRFFSRASPPKPEKTERGDAVPSTGTFLSSVDLHEILNAAQDMIFIIGSDGLVRYVNDVAAEHLGRRLDEIVGRPIQEFFPSDIARLRANHIETAFRTGKSQYYENPMPFRKGVLWLGTWLTPLRDPEGKVHSVLGVSRDITDRKTAGERAQENETLLREAQEVAHVGHWKLDLVSNRLTWSDEVFRIFGRDSRDFSPTRASFLDCLHPEDRAGVRAAFEKSIAERTPYEALHRIVRPDGATRFVRERARTHYDDEGGPARAIGTVQDVTREKQAELELEAAKQFAENLIQTANAMVVVLDLEGNVKTFNRAAEEITGYRLSEVQGGSWFDRICPRDKYPEVWAVFHKLSGDGVPRNFENPILSKSGIERYIVWQNNELRDGGRIVGTVSFGIDITERRQAEERISEAAAEWRATFDSIQDGILVVDDRGEVLRCNRAATVIFGRPFAEVIGKTCCALVHGRLLPTAGCPMAKAAGTGGQEEEELFDERLGRWLRITAAPVFEPDGRLKRFIHTIRDISEKKTAEIAILKSEEKYRSIFERAAEGIYQTTTGGRYLSANPALARMFGYGSPEELMAEVKDVGAQHYADPRDRNRLLEIIEASGGAEGFEFQGVRRDGKRFWLSLNAIAVRDETGRIVQIDGILEDIDKRKKAEEEAKANWDRLRRTLEATIQAMVSAVEIRDPYTAGHQRRVALLAESVARETGLSPERVEAIRVAAAIHDIGKIAVPAEILSKPTKLFDFEFELIKVHAQVGRDILKDIEFLGPIAEIVFQHHERLDGSGYPRGLKADRIDFEAKVLAVADVVEAMSSHRPYRPSLGLADALAEIERNSGRLYDPDAVSACLRLFREKGFSF
jgi:PAS domain S-box-containing protein/putative nucleotidyltransferase with HDIG domain